jgi:hypothetical protein
MQPTDDLTPLDHQSREAERSRARDADEHQRRIELEDLRWLMSDKRGRRFMHRLLEAAGIWRSSFTGDNATFFREGERNVGLRFLADVNEAAPERYATMLKEHRE